MSVRFAILPRKILITGARAPVALHLSRLLGNENTQVILADTFYSGFSAKSRYCYEYLMLPSPRFHRQAYLETLLDAIRQHNIQAIIPSCEEIFYLSQIQQELPVPLIAPSFELLQEVHNKFYFIKYVEKLGLNAPKTSHLMSRSDVEGATDQSHQLVFKPVWSRFAKETLVCVEPEKLNHVFPTPQNPWIAQEYIAGTEFSVYALAYKGKLVAMSSYKSLYRAGKGAGICFEAINEPVIGDWVKRFVQLSGWDGQVSFDMILAEDGLLYPIECNPRATSGVHFFQDPISFSQAFWQGAKVSSTASGVLGSRLAMWIYAFPKALILGKARQFMEDLRQTKDIFIWQDDPLPWHSELTTLTQIVRIAIRDRISLQSAATRDIEWNGPYTTKS